MPRRPNILFVFTDQQRPMSLGCAGVEDVHTPCLDALAVQGTRFSNAVATTEFDGRGATRVGTPGGRANVLLGARTPFARPRHGLLVPSLAMRPYRRHDQGR